MSSEEPRAEIVVCAEARVLLNGYGEAVKAASLLYHEQLRAIADGDLEAHRFDVLIHDAVEEKLAAKYAYLSHVQVHGCWTTHDGQIDTR